MDATLGLSEASRSTAGILLLSILGIEFGGWYMLRILQRKVDLTGFQRAFSRAGHAHAGVLVILGLVGTLLVDATRLDGAWEWIARDGVPLGAILVSAGFFLSAADPGRERPNRLIVLVWLGAAALAAGVVALGIGLLTA